MPQDSIDRRVYVEYLVWLAFTAVPLPFREPRYLYCRNFFIMAGYKCPV